MLYNNLDLIIISLKNRITNRKNATVHLHTFEKQIYVIFIDK